MPLIAKSTGAPQWQNTAPAAAARRRLFLTDGGLETTLIFHNGIELPHFAAFDLLRDREGRRTLARLLSALHRAAAKRGGFGFILEAPTWRASPDWGGKLGYSREALAAVNRDVDRPDGTSCAPSYETAAIADGDQRRHRPARRRLRRRRDHERRRGRGLSRRADRGLCRQRRRHGDRVHDDQRQRGDRHRARRAGVRHAGGRFPSRSRPTAGCRPARRCKQAIEAVDAATGAAPAYYMINCAHPTHFDGDARRAAATGSTGSAAFAPTPRSAAMPSSNEAPDLDAGDPEELGARVPRSAARVPAPARARRLLRHRSPPRRRASARRARRLEGPAAP